MSAEENFNWRDHAACQGIDPEIFFPAEEKDARVVIEEVCNQCSVQDACLEYAIRMNEQDGVWGGTTPKERKIIIRLRRTGS